MISPLPAVRLDWHGKALDAAPKTARLEQLCAGQPDAVLVRGDNLPALGALAGQIEGRVMLAYLDPPFFTGRRHERVIRQRDPHSGELLRASAPGFDDRWSDLAEYLGALAQRIVLVRRLLAPEGCLVLHVDPKTSHYAKVLCDEIFGPRCFASEIIWRYRRWPSKTKNFQRVHDVLLRYVRDPGATPRFEQLYEPLAPSTLQTWGTGKQLAVVDAKGRRRRSSTTQQPTPGTPLGDVWDIGIIAPVARERTGYPTQKPEALLERLVRACTAPGDLVLDPYAGSGTTLVVSARLGRRALGIDENPEALALARARLARLSIEPLEQRVVLDDVSGQARRGRRVA
jgi:site-specific DNA-methyltransferase (adenine-specific)